MPTQPMFDDPWGQYEFNARDQLSLSDDWRLESVSSAIHVGLEEQIERLESDRDLDDDQKWQELSIDKAPMAWLPKGQLLMVMYRSVDGVIERKAGFVLVG